MAFNPFRIFFPKKMVGVDIGTASIKVVELSKWGGGTTLENYGEIKSGSLFREPFRSIDKGSYLLPSHFASRAIRAVLEEANIKTKAAVFSLPDFACFFVSFDLPPMTVKELPEAVRLNATQYIPLPISETTLDWRVIEGTPGDKHSTLKVLVVAVANQVVQEYQRVAKLAGLELYALEAEALAAVRSLIPENKKCICLIDIGAQSTTVNVVDRGVLKKSYSFEFSSNQITHSIASSLSKTEIEADEIKVKEGLLSKNKNLSDTLYLLLDPLLAEIKKISSGLIQVGEKDIEEIHLTGGSANLPGLKQYFAESLKKNVEIPNCFSNFLYPPILAENLSEMSPRFSVTVGVALGGFQ